MSRKDDGPPTPPVGIYDELLGNGGPDPRPPLLRIVGTDEEQPTARQRQPVIAAYPGAAVMWVRTSDGHYVPTDAKMLRAELKHHQPHIDLWVPGKNDSFKPVSAGQLIEQHGRRVDEIFYDLTSDDTRYIHDEGSGGNLYIACAKRPKLEPEYNAEVDRWLRLLFDEKAEVGLDWLATLGILTRPTSALYLQGGKGNGKGMFADGCSMTFGGSFTSYDDVAGSNFNSSLKQCPVVFLDEKIGDNAARRGSGFFRNFVAATSHDLTEKYRPSSTLLGCIRLIICANNPDALRIREKLTPEDEDAIGERICHIAISNKAGTYLRSLGGRSHTANWVRHEETGRPGVFCKHIAWLEKTREVEHGPRFVVHGSALDWLKKAGQRGGPKQEILVALAKIMSGHVGPNKPEQWPTYEREQHVVVNPSRLRDCWRNVTGNATTYNVGTFGQELKSLASGKSCRVGPKHARMTGWRVPAQLVLDVAVEMGVGDVPKICKDYKLSLPEGWRGDEVGEIYDEESSWGRR